MKIVVCTKYDLPGVLILNRLLPALAGHELMVWFSNKTRGAEKAVPELMELKFLERDLPVGTLFPLIDALGQARLDDDGLLTFNGLQRRYGLRFKTVDDVNAPQCVAELKAFAPDLIFSLRFSHIFKPETYGIPRLGTFNVHPGALPHYAGLFAPFRAMMDGQDKLGCTLHRVDAKIDTGPIIGIGWLPVEPERGLLWHILGAYEPGIVLLLEAFEQWRNGKAVQEHSQDYGTRAYRSMPPAEAFLDFHLRHFRLYDPDHYQSVLDRFRPLDAKAGGAHAA